MTSKGRGNVRIGIILLPTRLDCQNPIGLYCWCYIAAYFYTKSHQQCPKRDKRASTSGKIYIAKNEPPEYWGNLLADVGTFDMLPSSHTVLHRQNRVAHASLRDFPMKHVLFASLIYDPSYTESFQ